MRVLRPSIVTVGIAVAAVIAFSQIQFTDDVPIGPPVQVKIGSTSLCVGRQFIHLYDLLPALEKNKPVNGYLGYRAELNLFDIELHGFIPEHYKSGIAHEGDRRKYPDNWVRITILPKKNELRANLSELIGKYYEVESNVDFDFKSHRAERQCVGKVEGMGYLQIQNGPECLDAELKFGNPLDASVVLSCSKSRCSTQKNLEINGVWFDYDFPKSFLPQWPKLHTNVRQRIEEWNKDRSCI